MVQSENWNPPATLTILHELNSAPASAVLSKAIKLYQDDDEANSKEVDSIDCSNLRPFRNGKPPVHEQPTWSAPPTKTFIHFLVSHVNVSFLSKEAHMNRQHARHTGLCFGMFLLLPVFADTCDSRSSFIFSFSRNCSRTFRSLPYGYVCKYKKYWIQHDSTWKCWATHNLRKYSSILWTDQIWWIHTVRILIFSIPTINSAIWTFPVPTFWSQINLRNSLVMVFQSTSMYRWIPFSILDPVSKIWHLVADRGRTACVAVGKRSPFGSSENTLYLKDAVCNRRTVGHGHSWSLNYRLSDVDVWSFAQGAKLWGKSQD